MGMSYQEFGAKIFKSVPPMVGLRMAESIQRRQSIAAIKTSHFLYPLYDWRDCDIWLYIKLYNLTIPMTYIYLYKTGVPANKLRISQFLVLIQSNRCRRYWNFIQTYINGLFAENRMQTLLCCIGTPICFEALNKTRNLSWIRIKIIVSYFGML